MMAEMKKKAISDDETDTILHDFAVRPCFFKFSFRKNH